MTPTHYLVLTLCGVFTFIVTTLIFALLCQPDGSKL